MVTDGPVKPNRKTAPEPPAPTRYAQVVDTWSADLLLNLGPVLPTDAYNHLHSAIGDLKTRLAAIEKEG